MLSYVILSLSLAIKRSRVVMVNWYLNDSVPEIRLPHTTLGSPLVLSDTLSHW